MEVINRAKGEVAGSPFYKINIGVTRSEKVKGHDLLYFSSNKIRSLVIDVTNDMIFKMSSGMSAKYPRPILISINVLGPISLEKAKQINNKNREIATNLGWVVGAPIGALTAGLLERYTNMNGKAAKLLGGAVGNGISSSVSDFIVNHTNYFESQDLMIAVEGFVSGGIGQQHSFHTEIIKRSHYDPLDFKM